MEEKKYILLTAIGNEGGKLMRLFNDLESAIKTKSNLVANVVNITHTNNTFLRFVNDDERYTRIMLADHNYGDDIAVIFQVMDAENI